jgi:HNH endonuclease
MTFKLGHPQYNSGRTHFKKGFIPWNVGKRYFSSKPKKRIIKICQNCGKEFKIENWRLKESKRGRFCSIPCNNIFHRGKNHFNWQGGTSFEPYTIDWTETLKRSIRERDKYICRLCNQYGKIVHHIDYDKQNCNPTNLVTLCRNCHTKTNFDRDYWIEYFINRMEVN